MSQEHSNFTSLAQQMAKEWMHKTPLATAIGEYIAELMGYHPNPESIMTILTQAKKWVSGVVISSSDQSNTDQAVAKNLPIWGTEEIKPPLKIAA